MGSIGTATISAESLDEFAAAVAGLFPPGVRTAVAAVGGGTSRHPLELATVMNARPIRREQFLAGRACAHKALAELGENDVPIGVGASREPLWPAGIVGSITHTRVVAAAAVARAGDVSGLGLDAELLDGELDPGQRALIFTPEELARLGRDEALEPAAGLVLFSAKESVYKCVFPLTGWRLNFHDVDTQLDLQQHRFAARLTAPSAPASASRSAPSSVTPPASVVLSASPPLFLEGAFALVAGHAVTGIAF